MTGTTSLSAGHGERAAVHEVVLHVDDDQSFHGAGQPGRMTFRRPGVLSTARRFRLPR